MAPMKQQASYLSIPLFNRLLLIIPLPITPRFFFVTGILRISSPLTFNCPASGANRHVRCRDVSSFKYSTVEADDKRCQSNCRGRQFQLNVAPSVKTLSLINHIQFTNSRRMYVTTLNTPALRVYRSIHNWTLVVHPWKRLVWFACVFLCFRYFYLCFYNCVGIYIYVFSIQFL